MRNRYFLGLDLGQAQDYSALAVLERPEITLHMPQAARRPCYALRHLQRFALGTPYPEVVAGVSALLQRPPLQEGVLVVDQTGVGRPVVDLLAEGLRHNEQCEYISVTITAGQEVTAVEGGMHVPKKVLVGTLQVLLQTRRLQIARSLPAAPLLVHELENFRVKITASRHETFEAWRSSQHDDLVLAVALAAWFGELALPALDEELDDLGPTVVYT